MQTDLLSLKVEKRPAKLRFDGRVLFLVDDADAMRRQLEGEDISLSDARELGLRDQISTDEITPAYICYYFDETLGEFPYLGLRAGGEFPVQRGTVKRGGFVCSVSGKRRGKGSSREQSPYAELMAGVRVVIAENIERIYNENCQNLGVLTSTDFDLIQRIRAGEEIDLAEFTDGVDVITPMSQKFSAGIVCCRVRGMDAETARERLRREWKISATTSLPDHRTGEV